MPTSLRTAPKRRATSALRVGIRRPLAQHRRLVPESRLVLSGISWETYRKIDAAFGNDNRPGTLLNYYDGQLEIMNASIDHERIKKCIGHMIEAYCLETNTDVQAQGSMTRRVRPKRAAEADESYSFDSVTNEVGLVVEVALSSGGLDKLPLYAELRVPEVWIWKGGRLRAYGLGPDGYSALDRSRVLPGLDLRTVEELSSWQGFLEMMKEF